MKSTHAVIALALVFVPATSQATAKTKTIEHTKIVGDTAVATWEYTQGNVMTFVSLVVSNENVRDATGKYERPLLSLAIAQSLVDTGAVLIAGSASSEDFTLTVDNQLDTATLHLANAIFEDDFNQTSFNISADLSWTATGELLKQNSNDRVSFPGFKMNTRFKGDFRDAIATGTITGNALEFAPVPSQDAQLQHNMFGSLTITTTIP